MANKLYEESHVQNIANAIRQKNGTNNTYNISEMAGAINNIPSGGGVDLNDYLNLSPWASPYSFTHSIINIPEELDTSKITSFVGTFANMGITNMPNINTSRGIGMLNMFYHCYYLESVSNFDLSNMTGTTAMFEGCQSLISVPNFNLEKVYAMTNMFKDCFNLPNIPNFNTANCANFSHAFENCHNFVSIPNINYLKAAEMNNAFSYCSNMINGVINAPNLTKTLNMFYNCQNLSEISGNLRI